MNNLLNCIQNESRAMADLVDALHQEQAALTQAPTVELMEEINAVTQKKNQLINTLSELGQLRNKELIRLGFKLTETSPSHWLQNKEQTECWKKGIEQTGKANELNRVNGLLINRHLSRNQSTLEVLYNNHHASNPPMLYSANGQSDTKRNNTRGFTA